MPDPSGLYPAPPKQPESLLNQNPLQLYGNVLQVQRSAQDLAARNAIGDIYRQNIQGGQLNEAGVINALKGSPAAGFLAPEVVGGALTREGQRLSNTGVAISNERALFEKNVAQSQFVASKLAGLADKDNISDEDLHNFVVQAARNTNVPASILNGWMRSLPKDSAGRKAALAQLATSMMSPEGAAAPAVTGYEGAAPIGGTAGQSSIVRRTGGGIVPPQPGVVEAATTAGVKSGGALGEAREAGLNYRRQVYPLEKAIPALENLGTTGTGPGAETINNLWSFAQTMGMPVSKKTGDTVKDYDEAKKYLTDWVMQNGNTGTNDKLAAAFSSNANTHISNAAAVDVAKSALALRRMQHAMLQDFEATGKPQSEFAQWMSRENAKRDPRVYGFDMLTPAQRNKVLASVPDRKKFLEDVKTAERLGIMHSGGLNAQ